MGCLIRVAREEPPSLKATFERDVDRWPRGLKARAGRIWLAQGAADLIAELVEHQDVGCKGVLRIEGTGPERPLLVAHAGQAVPGFQHVHLESLRIAEKRDPGRRIETRSEDRDRESLGDDNVFAVVWIEHCCVVRTERVRYRRRLGNGRYRQERRKCDRRGQTS